ncbi:hypothetical protein CK203_034740 [Vitis vinifera]|uniref:Uncharacterized protein n=1 Tax=Vitis vinifera TaxID=29760 RepID=A0A438HWK1_VITVI|nr:hypothetical protein CK203_034740 [Vitis vinifera]
MKEEDVFMPARELKIRRGLKEDEGGAGWSLVLGQSGSGEFRVPNGGPKPLYKGQEGRQMGKGMEGTGEILLFVAKRE